MKRIVLFMLLFIPATLCAQNRFLEEALATPYLPVDMEAIAAEVGDPASPFFYPALFARYEEGDTTLTLNDFRHLYYGFVSQPGYAPGKQSVYADSVAKVISRDGDLIRSESAAQLKRYISNILKVEPFNLQFNNLMAYIYEKNGEPEEAAKYAFRFNSLLQAVFSSGTGISKNAPWHVIYRADAQSIITILDGKIAQRMYVTATCEFFDLRENLGKVKGFYFDFASIYTRPGEPQPKPKRKFEFNPYQNPRSNRFENRNTNDYN